MRTLTIGFLTPFYFIRAGSLVSLPAVVTEPAGFFPASRGQGGDQSFGLYPVISRFRKERNERWYYTLLMSTGLTFGTISAIYGLSQGIVTRDQYSFLVAVVIAKRRCPDRGRHHGVSAPAPDAAAGRSPNAPTGRGLRPGVPDRRAGGRIRTDHSAAANKKSRVDSRSALFKVSGRSALENHTRLRVVLGVVGARIVKNGNGKAEPLAGRRRHRPPDRC